MTQPINPAAKAPLADAFSTVVNDTEQIVKSVTAASVESADALATRVGRSLVLAKERLLALQQSASESACAAAHATDEYVHLHPWQVLGIAAGFGFVVGAAIGVSMQRR